MADFNVEGRMDFAVTPFIRDMMKAEAAMAKAERRLDSLARKLDRLDRQRTNIQVGVDTTSAQTSISRLEQQLNRIRNKTVRVSTIQTGSATGATSSSATATTTVNVRGAERAAAELAGLEEARRRLDGRSATVNVFMRGVKQFNDGYDSMVNRMKNFPSSIMVSGLTAIATAAIPLGGVLGGILAGGMASVATAGAAVVTGVLPMVSAFQGAKRAADSLKEIQDRLAAGTGTAEEIARDQQALETFYATAGPQLQKFVENIDELTYAWRTFGDSFKENTYATFNTGIDMAIKLMDRFEPIARKNAAAIGAVVNEANRRLDTGEWENFYNYLEQSGGRFIQSWGNIVMDFGTGIGNMIVALDPLATDFTSFLQNTAQQFKEWSQTLSTNQGFQDFISYVRDNAPKVGRFISEMAQFIWNLVQALEPVGQLVLGVVTAIAQWVNQFAEANPAIFEMVTQGAALALMLSGLVSPLGSVLGLFGGLRGGVGLVGGAFGALSTIVGGSLSLLNGTNGVMSNLAINAGTLTERLTGSANAGSRVMTAVSGMGSLIPVVGLAFVAAGIQAQSAAAQVDTFTTAINNGGAALAQARTQAEEADTWFNNFTDSMQFGNQTSPYEAMFGADDDELFAEAQAEARAYRDSLAPIAQAQLDVQRETNDLSYALETYGAGSEEARYASSTLAYAQEELRTRQQELADATTTTSQRMTENATAAGQAAIAAAQLSNAQIAARQSLDAVSQAEANLTSLQNSGTATTQQLQAAQDQLTIAQNGVMTSAVQAATQARDLAVANTSAKTAAGQAAIGNAAYITSLQNLAAQASGPTRTAINQLITAAGGVPRDVRITAAAEVQGAINNLNRLAEAARSASSGQTSFRSTLGYTARNATGGINPRGQFSLVGEQGPEIQWLNRGDYVSTAAQSKMILKAQKAARIGTGTAMRSGVSNVPYKMAADAQGRGFSGQQSDGGDGGMVFESGAIQVHNYHPTDTGTSVSRELSRVQAFSIFSGGKRNARRSVES